MTDLHIFLDPVSDMFGPIGSVKTFSKVLGVSNKVGPYMAYILYIVLCLPLYKKGGFGGPKFHHHEFLAVFDHVGHQNG